jgi:hypothetical protein
MVGICGSCGAAKGSIQDFGRKNIRKEIICNMNLGIILRCEKGKSIPVQVW